jgi:hypothetical protein
MKIHACIAVLASTFLSLPASADDSQSDDARPSLDCTLYTKPYNSNEHGAFALPDGLKWQVLPRYTGRSETGERVIDERITLILKDAKNSFWPFIAKMSLEQADALQKELAEIIAQKRQKTVEP